MPPGSVTDVRGSAPRSRIQEYLARHVINPESIGDAYIRSQDVREAWSGHGTIEQALHPVILTNTESDLIRKSLLIFLSILVYIDAHEFLADFRAKVLENVDKDRTLRYCDSKLPLQDKDIPALGTFVLRKRFLDEQYLFLPEVLVESATIRYISDQRRLPFEKVTKNVSAGAYGKIDRIGISPSYFVNQQGWTFPEVKYVACKRFHAQNLPSYNDPKRELDNLQVLKESISSHTNIRLHLALLHYKGQHMILLPWADHLDLEIFLNEGRDFRGREIYDFRRRFHRINPGNMISDVSTQMYHVADALKWLHDGIITRGTQNRIRFAHMDLKPNNILIDEDDGSTVGKWVLTDFGISAFKEDEATESDNLVSVRDFYQNLTINTTPRRDPGAYQPPEVEHMAAEISERRNTPQAGSAGRRGDVWSFACIFAEALTFSLGQATLLREFRQARKGRHRNDYFYEVDNSTLQPGTGTVNYRVRPQIVDWLCTLPARFSFPKRAIDCYVETIQRMLVVDGSRRPKAYALREMCNHVASHVNMARAPGGLPANCPLEHPAPSTPPPSLVSLAPSVSGPMIRIGRIATIGEEETHTFEALQTPLPGHSRPGDASLAATHQIHDISSIGGAHLPTSFQERESHLDFPSSPPPHSATNPGFFQDPDRLSGVSEVTQTTMTSLPSSRGSKANLHGLMLNPERRRQIGRITECAPPLPRPVRTVSFHLCPSGQQVTYLVEQKARYEIHTFNLLSMNRPLERTSQSLQPEALISLPPGVKWDKVFHAGDYLAVWGNAHGVKQVYLRNRSNSTLLSSSEYGWLSTLITVAISKHGYLVFVCTKSLRYTPMDGDFFSNSSTPVPLMAKRDHSFSHAAFNDDGNLFYAWEYGRPDDRLSVMRVEQSEQGLVFTIDSEGSYPSKQWGDGSATVIPYNSYHGCIIQAHDNDEFFPAQIRSTQRGSHDNLEKKIVMIPKVVAACTFGDHSLLVATKGMFRATRIWEHGIVKGSVHMIERSREPLTEFKCRAGEGSQMRIVAVPNSDDLVIILCLTDGKILMANVFAQ